jgi:hypothetical protein
MTTSREHQKNKKSLKNLAHFSALKNVVQQHHVSHTIHHTHTTKTPHQTHAFFQKSQQISCSTTHKKNNNTAQQNPKQTKTTHLLQSANP